MKIKTLALILACLTFACSKKIVATKVKELSPMEVLLTQHQWLEGEVILVPDSNAVEKDITRQFPTQETDDVLVLAPDGTYKYDEGATKFKDTHTQIFVNGTWRIDNANQLVLTANESANNYEIVEATDSTLVLRLRMESAKNPYSYLLHFSSKK